MQASIAGLADGAHVVQFYADDRVLVEVMAGIVGTALVVGDSAVVFATAPHDAALRKRLRDRGLDVHIALEQGRYIALDAQEVIREFVPGDTIERDAFLSRMTTVIAGARAASASNPSRVVVFGEAVSLLLRDGLLPATLELERLWNELMATVRFGLCCGYDMRLFRGENPAAPFLRICGQHSQVYPAERRSASRLTRTAAAAADRR